MTKPACMDADEFRLWSEANDGRVDGLRVRLGGDSPCRDCTPLWHADMVSGGMCDGTPQSAGQIQGNEARSDYKRNYWRERRAASRERARLGA